MAKVLVSLDDALLHRIDRAARRRGLSRSAYLSRVAAAALDAGDGARASARARAALTRLDELFERNAAGEDSTTAVRAERDAR